MEDRTRQARGTRRVELKEDSIVDAALRSDRTGIEHRTIAGR